VDLVLGMARLPTGNARRETIVKAQEDFSHESACAPLSAFRATGQHSRKPRASRPPPMRSPGTSRENRDRKAGGPFVPVTERLICERQFSPFALPVQSVCGRIFHSENHCLHG
jgi:hypothetical protein